MWIWIAAGVLALIILAAAAMPLLTKLGDLRHAAEKAQRRQVEVEALQTHAQQLEQTLLGLQERAETTQERLALIKAGRGEATGKHAWPRRG